MSPADPEPDRSCSTLRVGQDLAGHRLVQDDDARIEGRFVSYAAAMAFAKDEREALRNATIVVACDPIVPTIPFSPVQPWEMASNYRRAA